MNKIFVVAMIALCMCVSPAFAMNITANNDSQSVWNESFSGSQNLTFYLRIPEGMLLDSANMNLTAYAGDSTTQVVQETADSYEFSGDWDDTTKAVDSDWSTYGYQQTVDNALVMTANYTKIGTNASVWSVKSGDAQNDPQTVEPSFTSGSAINCYNQNPIMVRIVTNWYSSGDGTWWYCWDGSSWYNGWGYSNAGYGSTSKIYEDEMKWQVNLPYKAWLSVGEDTAWNNTGLFDSSVSVDFAGYLSSYLATCSYVGGYCDVPVVVHSNTYGIIQFSDLVVELHVAPALPSRLVATLTDVGYGIGNFISSIQDPVVDFLMSLAFIGAVLSVFMAITFVIKGALTTSK